MSERYDIWRCPQCRGELTAQEDALCCDRCASHYPMVHGIPDFRLQALCAFDLNCDRHRVRALYADVDVQDMAMLVQRLFAQREQDWGATLVSRRVAETLARPDGFAAHLDGWLGEVVQGPEQFLDIGCGSAGLVAAAARRGLTGLGIDLSLEKLLVGRRMVMANGGTPMLAAAAAEALPLADGALRTVTALDVIEHVADPAAVLRESERVLAPGGCLLLATPNRYSLSPEPHVFVWGVGWLPQRWQVPYVRWRSGRAYQGTRLLSTWQLSHLIAAHTSLDHRIVIPLVDEADARGSRLRLTLIWLYNSLARLALSRSLFLLIGPFFRVLAEKPLMPDGPA